MIRTWTRKLHTPLIINNSKVFIARRTLSNGYASFKFKADGCDWNYSDIEEYQGKISFIYGATMTEKDIERVKKKWSHKM